MVLEVMGIIKSVFHTERIGSLDNGVREPGNMVTMQNINLPQRVEVYSLQDDATRYSRTTLKPPRPAAAHDQPILRSEVGFKNRRIIDGSSI